VRSILSYFSPDINHVDTHVDTTSIHTSIHVDTHHVDTRTSHRPVPQVPDLRPASLRQLTDPAVPGRRRCGTKPRHAMPKFAKMHRTKIFTPATPHRCKSIQPTSPRATHLADKFMR
jgi:hypothetical protein